MFEDNFNFRSAIEDFKSARHRAAIQEVIARITGRSNQLLSYEEVAEKLRLRISTERGIQNIPLKAIVGSVGRYTEFTRTFLPRSDSDADRWARVKTVMESASGFPPIDVYKVGEVYFVVDGNHRVSIARQSGFKFIEAHVTEFNTDVAVTSEVNLDDLIVKSEYIEFLDKTSIAESRPNVDLSMTVPGKYGILMEQINVCLYIFGDEIKQEAALQTAAACWYDTMYIPLAEAIRDRGLLHEFPNRTITDLYVWISENRAGLEKEMGWELQSEAVITELILNSSAASGLGDWRKAHTIQRYTGKLFADILIPLSGYAESWDALEQGIVIARRENARLHGLHVVETIDDVNAPDALGIKQRFDQACGEAGLEGSLAVDIGDITPQIIERAKLTDLVVIKLVKPPPAGFEALGSPFRTIIERSSRPLVTVPTQASQFKRGLLAYDGSSRAKEALFVAAYLAEMWKTELTVFTALEDSNVGETVQDYARRYLELHEVQANFIFGGRDDNHSLHHIATEHNADLILMGSHSSNKLHQVLMGSTVDDTLRNSTIPTFICR